MKTIREWLSELPEPYRSQALENVDEKFIEYGYNKNRCKSISTAILYAFDWSLSKQGHKYWDLLHIELIKNKFKSFAVKTVNEEAVIKSNREIAEEIFIAIDYTLATESEADVIEKILNKYFK